MSEADEGLPDGTALRASILAGERSAEALVEETLARIERHDQTVRAFRRVDAEGARTRARELDRELAAGIPPGPLFGLPLAIKSNMCLAGLEADCGSRVLEGYLPPYTATFLERALRAGAVPVGTTHMDEFAMGSSGENSAHAVARNPWDPERTPGGSSSGSAAAVAAGFTPLALGSDTGGSVRQPAALCGLVGFKPTYGRISRNGLVAFGSSLDQVSPLAWSVRDAARLVGVLSGRDELDATTLDEDPLPIELPGGPLEGVRIGLAPQLFPDALDAHVRERVEAAIDALRSLGATTHTVELPHVPLSLPTYYVVATAEASSNLARFDGVRFGRRRDPGGGLQAMMAATREEGFGEEVKRRILLGTYVLSSGYYDAWYGRALGVRALLREEFARAFENVDLLVSPTSPTAAFRLGERTADPLAMYLSDLLTVPASLAGTPAVSVPCGTVEIDAVELPVGLQILGPHGADLRVLSAAATFEAATDHSARRPRGFGGVG